MKKPKLIHVPFDVILPPVKEGDKPRYVKRISIPCTTWDETDDERTFLTVEAHDMIIKEKIDYLIRSIYGEDATIDHYPETHKEKEQLAKQLLDYEKSL